ncbi:MAG: nucleotide-binding protein [Nitrospinae bacterium]|nr:nucleotide-binding protein [Nitrospinota bacterium]
MKVVPVFIGSSTEGLRVARVLGELLSRTRLGDGSELRPTLWDQRFVFGVGESTLEALERALESYSFAVMVLTPDDVSNVRRKVTKLPRDNVLFEVGLFMGQLGPRRAFLAACGEVKIPTDLHGITYARVKTGGRAIAKLRAAELRKAVSPAAERIANSIETELLEGPIRNTVHYISPLASHSDYYNHFQILLESELAKLASLRQHRGGRISWQFHPNDSETLAGAYRGFESILREAHPEDVVIFVPQGVHHPRTLRLFKAILDQHENRHVILFDQPPPDTILRRPNVAFVGPDNREVGATAAEALRRLLGEERARRAQFFAVSGPGGQSRLNGFRASMQEWVGKSEISIIPFVDDVRKKNLGRAARFARQLKNNAPVGIFAGNDESAFALIEQLGEKLKTVCIVGCDATPAMQRAVEVSGSGNLATIDTGLGRQAQRIRDLIANRQWGAIEPVKPVLFYPPRVRG